MTNWNILDITLDHPYEVRHEGNKVILEIELPRFTKEQVAVSAQENVLSVSAQQTSIVRSGFDEDYKGRSYHRNFDATGLDVKTATATLKDGLLTISIPKSVAFLKQEIPVT